MFDSWPAQQAPLHVTLKQEPDSADGSGIEPSTSNARAKRSRKPSQRAVEMDVPQLVRQGSGKAVTTAAPSSSGSVPGQSKGRGRQRANPDAPETAQQRAHRKFYLRKKEALSSLEAIAAAKAEEYEALRAENEALRRKHAGLAATVAGRDTMLGVLSSISNLSLQDDDEQQQQHMDGATPPQQQRQQWQQQQQQWLHDLLPGSLHGAQQQQQQQPGSLPAVQRAQSLTPSLQSEQRTCSQGLHSDGCAAADGIGSAAFDDGPASALYASRSGQLASEQLMPQSDGETGMNVPDLSADADAAMTQLLAGFMEGLEASGGAAARAALEASLAADMQQAQQQEQQQQQQQQQQASCHQDCAQEEMHDSSSSLTGNACGTSSCCSDSHCEPGSSGRGNSNGNSSGMDNSSGRGGNRSGGGSKGGASSGPYSLNGMISWYGGAIMQLGAQLQALDNGEGGQEVQEELERQTRGIIDRLRKFAALDRVHHREMMLINMDTRERATPPRGHWERVVASAPLDAAKTAQLLACHDVFTEHMTAVRQERTALVQELQRAMSSMPQGDAVLSSSMRRLDEQGQGQRGQQGQGQQGGQLSLLDGPAASLQQRQFGSLSEAEAAFMLMGDLWDDRRQQQQQMPGAWDPRSSFPAAAQQLPGWASRPFAKRDPDAASADACLMDTNMTLLKRINDNLAREDLVNHMLAYALGHVLATIDIARSMVAAWPFYPDTPEVVAATVAAATAAAGQAPGKARNARPVRSPRTC